MADISLRIRSDFEQAEKDFKDLEQVSESTRKKIEKFSQSFKTEQIDKFIERNKMSAIAVSATSGKMAGMQKEALGLQREIQRLISKGLSPQSKEVQRLQTEYIKLNKDIKANQKSMSGLTSTFSKGIKAVLSYAAAYLSLRAAIGIVKKLTIGIAVQGDEAAKTSRRLGITAEALQEYSFAADRAGVSSQETIKSFEKLNKNVGDLRANTGSLNTILKNTNPTLLEQLKNVTSNEEAFTLITDAINNMTNPLDKASLAQAAFGRSGLKMLTVMENGTEGISELREEARKYGNVMSNEAAANSEKFIDSVTNAKAALSGLAVIIGSNLIPMITPMIQKFAEFVANNKELIKTKVDAFFKGFVSFIKEGLPIVKDFASMMFNFMKSMVKMKDVIGPIFNAIIAPIKYLIKWNLVLMNTYTAIGDQFIKLKNMMVKALDAIKYASLLTWEHMKIGFQIAAKAIISAMMLINKPFVAMMNTIISAFNRMTGKSIPTLTNAVGKFTGALDRNIARSQVRIKKLNAERLRAARAAAEEESKTVNKVNKASDKRAQNAQLNNKKIIEANDKEVNKLRQKGIAYKDVLESISISEQAANRKQIEEATKFFEERAELEGIDHETRMEYLQSQQAQILQMSGLTAQERLNTEKALAKAIQNEEKKMFETKVLFMQQSISTTGQMLQDLQTVFKNAGKESRELAILMRAVAIGEATINSYLAFTKALAAFPPPMNYIAAGITLAAGLAKVAAISTTPLPTAQTGGTFTVPDTPTGRNDRTGVMASPGETITVEPRGEEVNRTTSINIMLDGNVLYKVIQTGLDTGNIDVNNKNIGRGVFAR